MRSIFSHAIRGETAQQRPSSKTHYFVCFLVILFLLPSTLQGFAHATSPAQKTSSTKIPLKSFGNSLAPSSKPKKKSVHLTLPESLHFHFTDLMIGGEFNTGLLSVDWKLIRWQAIRGNLSGFHFGIRGNIVHLENRNWLKNPNRGSFSEIGDKWGNFSLLGGYKNVRAWVGFTVATRRSWIIPEQTGKLLWERAGQKAIHYSANSLEDLKGPQLFLFESGFEFHTRSFTLQAKGQALSWTPFGYRVLFRAALTPRGLHISIESGYTDVGGQLAQFGGPQKTELTTRAHTASWTRRELNTKIRIGYDFFRLSQKLKDFSLYLGLQAQYRYSLENRIRDIFGLPVFSDNHRGWSLWGGITFGLRGWLFRKRKR